MTEEQEAFCRKHANLADRVARVYWRKSLLRDPLLLEEFLGMAVVILVECAAKYDPKLNDAPEKYVAMCVARKCVQHYQTLGTRERDPDKSKKQSRLRRVDRTRTEEGDYEPWELAETNGDEVCDLFERVEQLLPPMWFQVVKLLYVDGLTIRQCASAMGWRSHARVTTVERKALAWLKQFLQSDEAS